MIDLLSDIPAATPEAIAASRRAAGVTQEAAALLAGIGGRARWNEYERGARNMDPTRWACWLLATGQHPRFVAMPRIEGRRPG